MRHLVITLVFIASSVALLTSAGCGDDDGICRAGALGCVCYPNQTCNGGLYCGPAGLCEESTLVDAATADASGLPDSGVDAGPDGATCSFDNDCDSAALTQGHLCRESSCTPCVDTADCVASAYYGGGSTCSDGRCLATPSCSDVGCTAGVCDELSGQCRDPLTCDQVGCVLGQLCQAETTTTDAECLADCEVGMAWNPVDGICEIIPDNCRTTWANSILSICETAQRACVEVEGGASCGECYQGYMDRAGTCSPVVTCSDLTCEADFRVCLPEGAHSDAVCGGCKPGFAEHYGVCETQAGATCDGVSSDSILAQCAGLGRECVEGGGGAGCGDCISGRVENPTTGLCEVEVTCAQLACDVKHRNCADTYNGHCTECQTNYEEDPATGDCRCVTGYIADDDGVCEPIRTCTDIQAGCTAAGMLCIEATDTHHAECQECPAGQAWYEHQQTCLLCPPCTQAGETGAVYPTSSQAGHCVCETLPGYFHSESGLGGTFACDKDGDGWVNVDARLALEAPEGTAERANARCELRTIDRFILENEWGERKEVLLSQFSFLFEPVALYEPVNRDRDDKLVNDYDYNNPLLANFAPRYGSTGRELLPEELNPLTKACATGASAANARFADYNADGHPDVDDLGVNDDRADPEGRIFAMFGYFVELHRGYYEAGPGAPHGQYVIREKTRSLYGVAGQQVALRYPAGGQQWRDCRRHGDSEFTPGGTPYTYDFADYGEEATCNWGGDSGSWCGMNHHSQFKCLQVTAVSDKDAAYPHHLTSAEIDAGYEPNLCEAEGDPDAPLTATKNPSDPALSCQVGSVPASGNLVWGAAKFKDYGHVDAPNVDYIRGCVNECVEQPSLPAERQCQGLPPISCRGLVDNHGRLFCYRPLEFASVSMAGESFTMGSPVTEPGRNVDEVERAVSFTGDLGYSGLEVTVTEISQDQFLEFLGFNPSRFDCGGSVCPVEQVTWYDAVAFANVLSDVEGYPRCYDRVYGNTSMTCADGTTEDMYDPESNAYLGTYCREHGGILWASFDSSSLRDAAGNVREAWRCDGYRLPTEAEWEFLARAGTTTATYAGDPTETGCDPDPLLGTIAWTCANADFGTHGVTLMGANSFGLYDTIGNVWEWVSDRYDDYLMSDLVNPAADIPCDDDLAVARGGAWNRGVSDARAARRVAYAPGARNFAVGFRLVRSVFDLDISSYEVVPSAMSWDAAEAECVNRNGHLVSIDSLEEQWAVRKAIGWYNFQNGTEVSNIWIGLNDQDAEGNWVWSDGSTSSARFWRSGEPNNSGNNEDCVEVWLGYMDSQQAWNDARCYYERPFVCEK